MLQNLKNILLNIRKERENQNNSSFLSRDESTAKQLRAIAILDLPFKTDPESITKARHHVIGNLGKINIKITPTIADA